jgi:hypothetical protein
VGYFRGFGGGNRGGIARRGEFATVRPCSSVLLAIAIAGAIAGVIADVIAA